MAKKNLYFRRGYIDATDPEDVEQIVGIDPDTKEIVDDADLIYRNDVPDLSQAKSAEDIISSMQEAGWEHQEDI